MSLQPQKATGDETFKVAFPNSFDVELLAADLMTDSEIEPL